VPTSRSGGRSSAGSDAGPAPHGAGSGRIARSGNLADNVRRAIERKILEGAIGAGQKLNASALAAELEVSRAPVREALRALEEAGLVRSVPNQGVFVREVSLQEALDLYDIRIGLARQAGRLLAARATQEQLKVLARLQARMERARARGDADAYHRLNLLFHSQLMRSTGNSWLWAMDEGIKKQLHLCLRRGIAGPGQLRVASAEHRALLDAVGAGDPERAADAYERHSIGGKQRLLDTVGRAASSPQAGPRTPVAPPAPRRAQRSSRG
jgi:DNA-binding GntR family transcriptional regulator